MGCPYGLLEFAGYVWEVCNMASLFDMAFGLEEHI